MKKLAGCQELSSIGTLLCKSYTEAPTMPDDTYIVMYPKFSGYAGRAYEAERYVEGGAIHSGIKTALTRIQDIYVNIGNILISKGVIKKADYIETLPSYCKTIIVNEGSLVDDPTES